MLFVTKCLKKVWVGEILRFLLLTLQKSSGLGDFLLTFQEGLGVGDLVLFVADFSRELMFGRFVAICC